MYLPTMRHVRNPIVMAALALVLLAQDLGATPLCRWVDAQSGTPMSDVAPERCKDAEPAPALQPQPGTKRPSQVVTDTTDCPTWWRIYDESSACFGPFKTTRGGIKPEAFDQCNEVKSPELKCGPRRN